MSVELTQQQQQALDAVGDSGVRLVDPRTRTTYVLLPEALFQGVREFLEEERRQRVIESIAVKNAAGRMDEEP